MNTSHEKRRTRIRFTSHGTETGRLWDTNDLCHIRFFERVDWIAEHLNAIRYWVEIDPEIDPTWDANWLWCQDVGRK